MRARTLLALLPGVFAPLAAPLEAGERGLGPRQSERYVHRAWRTDDGLPQNSVQAITQTRDGYMWLATQEGLVRFDGVSFVVFDHHHSDALKTSFITALCEDREGALWIGTGGGGLARLQHGAFRSFTSHEGLPGDIVTSLALDRSGGLWIGTERGLARMSDGRLTSYGQRDGLPDDDIRALFADRDGSLWASTRRGFGRWKGGRWSLEPPANGRVQGGILYRDRTGRLWIGGADEVVCLDRGKLQRYGAPQGLLTRGVTAIADDRQGNVWIGTSDALYRVSEGRVQRSKVGDGSSAERILALCEDREGSLWVGTDGGGLHRLRPARLEAFTASQGLPRDNVLSIHGDPEGGLWLGSYGGGVVRLAGGRVTTLTTRDGLTSNDVAAVYADRGGNVWVGLIGAGLERLRLGRPYPHAAARALAGRSVIALQEDRAGRLWIGTSGGGLYGLEGGRLSRFTKADGLADDTVFAIQEDADGSLWVGTRGGLSHLAGGKLLADPPVRALSGRSVVCLHRDAEGTLWIGTYRSGLRRWRDGRFFSYTMRQGLFDDVVFQILEDDAGQLWMSCNKGLFSVAKKDLEAVARGDAERVISTAYGTEDGMPTAECNGASQPGAWRAADGRLWFPTVGGAVVVDPERVRRMRNTMAPPVHIEALVVDGGPLDVRDGVRAPPGRGELEIRYTGLSLVAPQKVRFKYRLEGFDPGWTHGGASRVARYTNLPPGAYRFHVIACNNEGVWNDIGASLAFRLEPHFHQTAWFRSLPFVALILGGWGVHRLRSQKLRTYAAVLAERNRIAREIHDGLAQSLTGVLLQIEAADQTVLESAAETREHLDRARRWTRHSLTEARRAVSALRPAIRSVSCLKDALLSAAEELTRGSDIHVDMKACSDRPLSEEIGANLLRIGQEAVTNAVRYAKASRLLLEIGCETGRLRLRVHDDGSGFDPAAAPDPKGSGFGLPGMRERAESVGGQLSVRSQPGTGTDVVALVPLGRQATP